MKKKLWAISRHSDGHTSTHTKLRRPSVWRTITSRRRGAPRERDVAVRPSICVPPRPFDGVSKYESTLALAVLSKAKIVNWSTRDTQNTSQFCVDNISLQCIHTLSPGDAYMHQWTGSSLVQAMACRICVAKSLPGPLTNNNLVNFNEIWVKVWRFYIKKMYLKNHLLNGGKFSGSWGCHYSAMF